MGKYLYQPEPSITKPSHHKCKLGEWDYSRPRFERYTNLPEGTVWLCECGKLWVVKRIRFNFDSIFNHMWKRMWIKPDHIVDALMKEEE